jgi:hypothetical protein
VTAILQFYRPKFNQQGLINPALKIHSKIVAQILYSSNGGQDILEIVEKIDCHSFTISLQFSGSSELS